MACCVENGGEQSLCTGVLLSSADYFDGKARTKIVSVRVVNFLLWTFAEIPSPEYDLDPLLPVDPEGCLRNREEAAARGRQCLRKCASDADCISSRKRCLCDGLCGWSCIRPGETQIKCHSSLFNRGQCNWHRNEYAFESIYLNLKLKSIS
ncbi:uncharacterized protein TNCT_40751 [Trichonephila clavata]|uniref:WAP domain-containing protein n=1 Tax=Trichonephila clavata TaxID=2740835 RepID=A0A8X6GYL7_TRICU|nr:uncharacterized protein TNCT_40751 [Trichonephila clavata]